MHAKSSAVRYIPLYKISSSRAETDLSPCRCSQDPGLPSKGRGTLAEWLCCGSEQGLRFPSSQTSWLSRLKAFSHRTTWGQLHFDLALMYLCERHTDTFLWLFRIWGPGLRSERSWTQKCEFAFFMWTPDPQEMWMWPCSQVTLVMTHTHAQK